MSTNPSSPSADRARAGRIVATAVVAVAVALGGWRGVGGGGTSAAVVTPQDLPPDVRTEIETTWSDFTAAFAGRLDCIGPVTLVLVGAVEEGDARYLAGDARIEIEIPTTPARFRESLAHELAHHVEHGCDDFGALREVLHAELGPDRPWRGGSTWYDEPSERWAEHVVELVNGERVRHVGEVPVDADVVELIGAWGAGDPVP